MQIFHATQIFVLSSCMKLGPGIMVGTRTHTLLIRKTNQTTSWSRNNVGTGASSRSLMLVACGKIPQINFALYRNNKFFSKFKCSFWSKKDDQNNGNNFDPNLFEPAPKLTPIKKESYCMWSLWACWFILSSQPLGFYPQRFPSCRPCTECWQGDAVVLLTSHHGRLMYLIDVLTKLKDTGHYW